MGDVVKSIFGGGGSPPVQSVEKFDPKKFIAAQRGTIDAQLDALPEIGRILGQTNREQGAADLQQFVNLIQDPGDVIYASGISDARNRIKTNNQKLKSTQTDIADLKGQLANKGSNKITYKNAKGKTVTLNRQDAKNRLKTLQGNLKTFKDKQKPLENQLAKARRTAERFDINKAYDKAFPEISKAQDAFVKQLGQSAKPTAEYNALQKELEKTRYTGEQMTPKELNAETMAAANMEAAAAEGAQIRDVQNAQAAQAGPVRDVNATSVGDIERVSGTAVESVNPMEAARVARTQDVQSQGIRASAAERALMNEAQGGGLLGQLQDQAYNDLALGRSLSAEQSRDAIQSARAGMAARGLSTGNSSLAAELLNRDRFATQRENERRAFASGVLNQGTGIQQAANQAYMGRMEGNRGRALQAALANQSVAADRAGQNAQLRQQAFLTNNQNELQRALAEAGYAQQAALSNQDFSFRSASQDAQSALQAQLANQQTALSLGQSNAQLQQAANLANFDFATTQAIQNAQMAQQNQQFNATNQQAANLANANFLQDANQFNAAQRQATNIYNQQTAQDALAYNNQLDMNLKQANLGLGQTALDLSNAERLRQLGVGETLVNTTTAYDPRMRLLGVAQPNNQIAGLASQTGNDAAQIGASGYTFGINQNNSLYNTWQTNRTAERVGMMGIIGNTIQGIASGAGQAAGAKCWIARAAWGEENPRWVEFRDSMLTHAPEWFIRFYCRFGPAIARHIHTPARRAIARLILATLQHLWTPANPKLQPA